MLTTNYRTMFQAKANNTVTTLTDSLVIVTTSDWHHVSACVRWDKNTQFSTITLRVDNIQTVTAEVYGMIYDYESYYHYLGAEQEVESSVTSGSTPFPVSQIDNFYTGFIWQVCLYTNYISNFSDIIGGPCEQAECQVCPKDICLMDCDWNQFRDPILQVCDQCRIDCEEGCQNDYNCNVCLDEQCADCPKWSDCNSCIQNAGFVGDDCECLPTFTYNPEFNSCTTCAPECEVCSGSTNLECSVCADGFNLQKDSNVCLTNCPTGLISVNKECVED